jgi:hypothetical protein
MTAILLGDGHAQPAAADDGVVELLGNSGFWSFSIQY